MIEDILAVIGAIALAGGVCLVIFVTVLSWEERQD
jgi:hypothetical protein